MSAATDVEFDSPLVRSHCASALPGVRTYETPSCAFLIIGAQVDVSYVRTQSEGDVQQIEKKKKTGVGDAGNAQC